MAKREEENIDTLTKKVIKKKKEYNTRMVIF